MGQKATASWCARRCSRSAATFAIDLTVPFGKLPRKQRDILLAGGKPGSRDEVEAATPSKSASAKPSAKAVKGANAHQGRGRHQGIEGRVRRHPAETCGAGTKAGPGPSRPKLEGVSIAATVHRLPGAIG